jgi:two-component system LytT family response regulator
MTKRILIVDDEKNSRDIIALMLDRYAPQFGEIHFARNCKEAVESIQKNQPHLVFMDLEMPDGTGFDILAQASDNAFEAVFVTAYEKRFLPDIKLSNVPLMLKPIDRESLLHILDRSKQPTDATYQKARYQTLIENITTTDPSHKKLIVPLENGFKKIPIQQIIYLEQQAHQTKLILEDETVLLSSNTFKFYVELFQPLHFFQNQPHQLLQLKKVQQLRTDCSVHLTNQIVLDVAARRMKELQALLNANRN